MDPDDFPECPVCLQPYDNSSTIPRVLACGHSTCQTCLTQLPKPFPHTLRCPACTHLVNYPHSQGPSALPKNIDLLRLSSLLQNPNTNPTKPTKPNNPNHPFLPNLWPHHFYSTWNQWVLPKHTLLLDSNDGSCGRIVTVDDSLGLPISCFLKENQRVSLARVCSIPCEDDSDFRFSYAGRIMGALYEMRDVEREELTFILRAGLKQSRLCRVYGLWCNEDDRGVYLVCERYSWSFSNKLDDLRNGFVLSNDMSGFAMIGMEICEAVRGLPSEGLISGCLALSWFDFDDLGHVCIDFNEILLMGRRVRTIIVQAVSDKQENDGKKFEVSLKHDILKTHLFVSPELLFKLLWKEGIDLGSDILGYAVGYGSDVWSLACLLIWLLVGHPFIEEMCDYLCCLISSASDEKGSSFMGLYVGWLEKVHVLLETRLSSEFVLVKECLCKCLCLDPEKRPLVTDIWKCIRGLIIKPKFDIMVSLELEIVKENKGHCLVLGELCRVQKRTLKGSGILSIDGLSVTDADIHQVAGPKVERDLIEGLSRGHVKCIDLKGHLDCISGLAVGGGFLFSSSFDKTVHVWSLQDFTHVHLFKGHEHKVMAIVCVDEEQLCVSGDSGGGICIWGANIPFAEQPIKRLYEQKDWRYSGIHALAISGTGYLYTGSGDRSIKAWSMLDYTLSCTMTGHKSVVSTLGVCNGVLYSGSWDGTVRLWSLSDHRPLTVLGEESPGNVISVLSLAAAGNVLIVAYETGLIKIWSNDVLRKTMPVNSGAIFSVSMEGKWLFTGGLNKSVNVQELLGDDSQIDAIPIGSIACGSVITTLLYCQGKLFVGQADRVIKVYYHGV